MNVLELERVEDFEKVVFESTRGGDVADFWRTLVDGLGKDGGLFVPEKMPKSFGEEFINGLSEKSISEISAALLRKFIPEAEIGSELGGMMEEAHNFDIPLNQIEGDDYVAWLSEGPTASFKDIAARAIAQLMEKYCIDNQKPKNILVATSGDTGVAIADAFGGSEWVTVTVLYPKEEVSQVQESQMIEANRKHANVQCLPIDGVFDDAQNLAKISLAARDAKKEVVEGSDDAKDSADVVKDLVEKVTGEYKEKDFSENDAKALMGKVEGLGLSSANSINIWRLIPQMTQYFVSYGKLVAQGAIKEGEEVVFSVPTGNVGHLMAGVYAKELGLPIKKFIVGTNENDIMKHFLQDGVIRHDGLRSIDGEMKASSTSSNSMDIANPSNLERLIDYAKKKVSPEAEIDYVAMKKAIQSFDKSKNPEGILVMEFGVTEDMMEFLQGQFYASTATDNEVVSTIESVAEKTDSKEVLEPHGAAGYKAIKDARKSGFVGDDDKVVLLETAHALKFPGVSSIEIAKTHKGLNTMSADELEALRSDTVGSVSSVLDAIGKIAEESRKRRSVV